MINLIRADFYKIHRSVIYKVLFAIMVLCAVSTTLVSHFLGTGDMDIASASSAGLLTDVVMLNLVSCIVAGQLVCGDFENKLIQSALTGTSGRFALICSKIITYTLLVGVMALPYALCSVIGWTSGAEFGAPYSASVYLKILSETATVDFSAAALLKYIAITAIMALIYSAQTAFVFMLAFIFKNKALIVTAVGFIVCTFIGMTSSMFSQNNEAIEKVISWTPFGKEAYTMCNATEPGTMLKVLLIAVAYLAVFTCLTYATFKKAEIK